MDVDVTKVFSFTEELNHGNPAGVVFDSEGLNETQMKMISKKLHVSETAFFSPCDEADYLVRFFSPTVEVDLCGHATIAAFSIVGKRFENTGEKTLAFTQKTQGGILDVICHYDDHFFLDHVMMEQQKPDIQTVSYEHKDITDALRIPKNHIRNDFPKKRVSTGLFTLPIGVDSFEILKEMKPDFKKIEQICRLLKVGSFHVFTFDALDESSLYHARNFAPFYGVNEDPVTGTANGAVCAYLDFCNKIEHMQVVCEQGDIMGKPGRVQVDLTKGKILVGGKAAIEAPRIISI